MNLIPGLPLGQKSWRKRLRVWKVKSAKLKVIM